ncbi:hypothetical protein [Actinomycetospora succinea]|nr:hypothetical protein [Actinomycetospora succinea]
MLAVVLLLPIVIMVVACLLERFEAHAVVGKPAPRVRRPLAIEPPAPSLTLVPGADEDDTEDSADDSREDESLAPATGLRKAS